MPFIASFYSMDEAEKARTERVYHNNSACAAGRRIELAHRRASTGGHRICADCGKLNTQELANRW